MTNFLYSREDTTTGEFSPPIVAVNDDNACRNLLYLFGQIDPIARVTFRYWRIGMWNNETAALDGQNITDITALVHDMNDRIFGGATNGSQTSDT